MFIGLKFTPIGAKCVRAPPETIEIVGIFLGRIDASFEQALVKRIKISTVHHMTGHKCQQFQHERSRQ